MAAGIEIPETLCRELPHHGAFHEDCTVAIAKDTAEIKPKWLRIGGYWYARWHPIDVSGRPANCPRECGFNQGVAPYAGGLRLTPGPRPHRRPVCRSSFAQAKPSADITTRSSATSVSADMLIPESVGDGPTVWPMKKKNECSDRRGGRLPPTVRWQTPADIRGSLKAQP